MVNQEVKDRFPEQVCILGATGSIGMSTLDVIALHPARYQVYALTGHQNVELMTQMCIKFQPAFAHMADPLAAERLAEALRESAPNTEVVSGAEALSVLASHPQVDIVMSAIVGAAGLLPTLAAIRSGKKVLLANKESLVMAGELFMAELAQSDATLLPIDSEHNAIFQCLPDRYRCGEKPRGGVKKLILTASGGPFRKHSRAQLETVTAAEACRHPNWSMGQKISVDSASLMNKGLELIEACWLFNLQPENVEVVVHPESIIHSLVEYIDGSVLAQMGNPDMRTPIAYALAYPERINSNVEPLGLSTLSALHFEAPDLQRFPCLGLASEAFRAGGVACAVLNAANEQAVAAFLKGNIDFMAIPDIIGRCLEHSHAAEASSISALLEADQAARALADQFILSRQRRVRH